MTTSTAFQAENSPRPLDHDLDHGFVKIEERNILQFWESEATRPHIDGPRREGQQCLLEMAETYLPSCLQHPFQTPERIEQQQFERVRELVEMAFHEIPVYGDKYRAIGFQPSDLKSWADFERLPVITKDELIAAFPHRSVSRRWSLGDLFSTRTFGSSGKTLMIKVNRDSILKDTFQGVRQFWLQSGLKYGRSDLTAMIYTVPWWFETVGDDFRTAFISGLISPPAMGRILDGLQPQIISCYPTNLKALLPLRDEFDRSQHYLSIVHSESSTRHERRHWSEMLGVPVLDEYSSEEATRIALELPCGHYHVCEDAVRLEVIDPKTGAPQTPGTPGLAVITNLLNEAMPFIRYVQGDYVTRPSKAERCLIGWSVLDRVDGRINDSFVTRFGHEVPAGTILDVIYRWMYDAGVNIAEFELVQTSTDAIRATFQVDSQVPQARIQASIHHLQDLLEGCMGHPVKIDAVMVAAFPKRTGKRRPIRRELAD